MNECRCEVPRKAWELPFLAKAREIAGLRRVMRLHLTRWGLPDLVDAAQLCVTELVANVVRHVGPETPTTLAVSMNGTNLRIEVQDPDTRALPILMSARDDDEAGRGMALVDATADRWGVVLSPDSKVTWCELATGLTSSDGHAGGPRVACAEALLCLYGVAKLPQIEVASRLSLAIAEEAAIDVIADLLHWLRAHGCDPDEALDRAQTHFEAEVA
ncbi:ATP-binding protein [Streptomyces formicae]|uniref:ATP-binding protein n=1 Tax=Streptomyces formicae TaxID=1616117 RepID=A0ABY3WZX0_9ACTN|nr:ATP-binding protein [Streptomyces formicae]UNM16822.1 ATP-binding protein [Streptomyces formicae]